MPEPTHGRVSSATFTPAAAAYSASDIFEGKKEFAGVGPILGGSVIINTSELLISEVGSSRVDLQACKLEYSIVSPK